VVRAFFASKWCTLANVSQFQIKTIQKTIEVWLCDQISVYARNNINVYCPEGFNMCGRQKSCQSRTRQQKSMWERFLFVVFYGLWSLTEWQKFQWCLLFIVVNSSGWTDLSRKRNIDRWCHHQESNACVSPCETIICTYNADIKCYFYHSVGYLSASFLYISQLIPNLGSEVTWLCLLSR